MACTRSPATWQQTQPLGSSTMFSEAVRTSAWSIATGPNSFTITAQSPAAGCATRRLSSVVLPLPRKPVSSVTGVTEVAVMAVGGRASGRRRKGPAR